MADGKITIGTKIDQLGAKAGIKDLQKNLEGSAKKMQSVGSNMTKYITAPFVALAAMGIKAATDFSSANRTIQQGLGVTGDEADKLTEKANNIYKKGFGESLPLVAQALIDVTNNFGDLVDEADLEKVTTDALALSKVLDADVNETSRAGSALMREFGDSSTEAFDMLAWGAQNGLNYSDEMLDNIAEYAPLFNDMGYSSEEYFALLKKGTEEGSYNLDYLNDVMKEFQIRLTDGSDKTADAMGSLSSGTQELFEKFQNGEATVKEVMSVVTDELGTMDEKTANMIGVELFGTKWEDLGSEAVMAMGNIDGALEGVDGAMTGITESQEEAFGQRFQALLRESLDSLRPVGEVFLDLSENILPPIIAGIQNLSEWFSGLSPIIQIVIIAIGALIAILGPLLVMLGGIAMAVTAITWPVLLVIAIITAVIAIVVYLAIVITQNWELIKTTTIWVFTAIGAFFTLIWTTIKTIFTITIQAISNGISTAWNWIKTTTSNIWNGIKNFFVNIWSAIKNNVSQNVQNVKSNIENVWNKIKSITETVWNGIKSFFTGIWDNLLSGVESFKSAFLGVWEGIKNGVRNIINPIIGFINGMIGALQSMINGISSAVNSIPNFDVPDWVPGIGGGSFGLPNIGKVSLPKIPSLDVGTNLVKSDGLAMIHKGEEIRPAEHSGPYKENGQAIDYDKLGKTMAKYLRFDFNVDGDKLANSVNTHNAINDRMNML